MINFDLPDLHPSYERLVRDVLNGLAIDYPIVGDLRVSMFDREGDESLGCAPERGMIKLNKLWFGRPIEILQEAARTDDQVMLRKDAPTIGWHGSMEEPQHLLCHEFGHQLQMVVPGWPAFDEEQHRLSCADPVMHRPPSGYCLSDAVEFGPDVFAAMRLRYPCRATRALWELLHEIEAR
jgi:hypothetical protein